MFVFFFQVSRHSWNSYHISTLHFHCHKVEWRRREAKITTKYRFNRPKKTLSHSWGLTSESLIRGRIIIINYSDPFQANVEKIILKFTFIIIILERTVLSFIGRIHRIKINISLLALSLFIQCSQCGPRCNAKFENEPQRTTRRNGKISSHLNESLIQTLYPLPCVLCIDVSMRLSFITNIHSTQMYCFFNEMKIRSSLELGPEKKSYSFIKCSPVQALTTTKHIGMKREKWIVSIETKCSPLNKHH